MRNVSYKSSDTDSPGRQGSGWNSGWITVIFVPTLSWSRCLSLC